MATDWADRPLYFTVSPDAPRVDVEVLGGGVRNRYSLPQDPPEPPGLLTVPFSTSWRRHPYWWTPGKTYENQILRFSLAAEGDEAVTAVVRYAGRGRELAPLAATLAEAKPPLPAAANVGRTTDVVITLQNTGRRPWRSDGPFPIKVGYRLVVGDQGKVASRGIAPLPARVPPGESIEVPLTIRWPEQTGSYQLTLDLLREPASALGRAGRLVLTVVEVQLESAPSPDSPAP